MGTLILESDFGPIAIEVDDDELKGLLGADDETGFVRKGAFSGSIDLVAKASVRFEETLNGLKALVGGIQSSIGQLPRVPTHVEVDVALKFSGSLGFVLAKAGTETVVNVTLKWSPGDN